MKILLVEDNLAVGQAVVTYLSRFHTVQWAKGYRDAFNQLALNQFSLIIADIGLGDGNGLMLCSELRKQGHTLPMLIITANVSQSTKINALSSTVDDYLIKPFYQQELGARVQALLRRTSHSEFTPNVLTYSSIVINVAKRECVIAKTPVVLRKKELDILIFLLIHPEQVISRSTLIEQIWHEDTEPFSNTVDVHISNIRNKVEHFAGKRLIHTVKGYGYKLSQ